MKKIFILAFIVLPIKLLFANDLLNDVVYNGNLVLLENLIKPQQLMNFQLEELRILRNMIYAKYDYRFRSNDLQEYFSQFEWYNGTEDNVEKYLTTLDYINIRTIQSLEDEYPFIIPYNDERIYNLENFGHYRYYNNFRYRISENELVLMGWSPDGHLFVARSSYDGMDGVRVYNLKENKIVWYGMD
jgi:hypothetical protein